MLKKIRGWISLMGRIHRAYYVYIMSNKPFGVLYIGVTNNLIRRVFEHREGLIEGFTQKYNLKRLVYYKAYEEISPAIQREKTLKHWIRQWKINLVTQFNPNWDDLWLHINGSC